MYRITPGGDPDTFLGERDMLASRNGASQRELIEVEDLDSQLSLLVDLVEPPVRARMRFLNEPSLGESVTARCCCSGL
jgi:hypothetical protein